MPIGSLGYNKAWLDTMLYPGAIFFF